MRAGFCNRERRLEAVCRQRSFLFYRIRSIRNHIELRRRFIDFQNNNIIRNGKSFHAFKNFLAFRFDRTDRYFARIRSRNGKLQLECRRIVFRQIRKRLRSFRNFRTVHKQRVVACNALNGQRVVNTAMTDSVIIRQCNTVPDKIDRLIRQNRLVSVFDRQCRFVRFCRLGEDHIVSRFRALHAHRKRISLSKGIPVEQEIRIHFIQICVRSVCKRIFVTRSAEFCIT